MRNKVKNPLVRWSRLTRWSVCALRQGGDKVDDGGGGWWIGVRKVEAGYYSIYFIDLCATTERSC